MSVLSIRDLKVGFDTALQNEPIISNVKDFLSMVPMVLAIWPALFSGIHLLSTTPIAAVQRLGSDGAWHDVPVVAESERRYRLDVRLEIAVPGIFRLV